MNRASRRHPPKPDPIADFGKSARNVADSMRKLTNAAALLSLGGHMVNGDFDGIESILLRLDNVEMGKIASVGAILPSMVEEIRAKRTEREAWTAVVEPKVVEPKVVEP